jgi:hypothetical protein
MMPIARQGPWRFLPLFGLLLVLLLGLYLRLATVTGTRVDRPIRNDAKDYVAYAWNLKFFGVYSSDNSTFFSKPASAPQPDAERPPAYPLLLRTFMGDKLDYSFIERVYYAQAWIAELILLCSTLLAMELIGVWAGLAVGMLVALSPHQSIYVVYLLTETLFGAAIMLALAAGVFALRSQRVRWRLALACLAGLLFGLSCLARPTLDQWPWLLVVLLLWPSMRRFRREIIALALGFVLMMSPWWVRNEITLHRMSDPGKMIQTIHDGSYPNFMYQDRPETFGYPYSFDPNTAKAESSWPNILQDLWRKFANRPLPMLQWYLFGKLAYFFHWSPPDGWVDMFTYPVLRSPWLTVPVFVVITSVMRGLYAPLIVFGVLGTCVAFLPRTRRLFGPAKADGIRFVAFLHLFAMGVHVLGAPFARYSVPFRPITFLLALFFIVWVYRAYHASKQEPVDDLLSNA